MCSPQKSGCYFPLRLTQKPRGTSQLSPHSSPFYLKTQISVKTGRAARRCCPTREAALMAASRERPRRHADGGTQTATCFWRHKTCLHNDIFVTTSVVWDTGLAKPLCFPGPFLGAPGRMMEVSGPGCQHHQSWHWEGAML